MKKFVYIIALLLTVETVCFIEIHKRDGDSIQALSELNGSLERENEQLTELMSEQDELIQEQSLLIDDLSERLGELKETASRGAELNSVPKRRIMEVTAYDLSYQSCGKHPDHPLYGITASGKYVEEWNTIAAGPELPFGTRVYIPYFKDKPNGGIFTVMDRGGGVKNGRLDVYMKSYTECMEFGRRKLEVWVLD